MTEQTDREKLAREMMGALAFFENGAVKQVTTFNQCADIAIAYADRRVAEAVAAALEQCAVSLEEISYPRSWIAQRARALSPAREGWE